MLTPPNFRDQIDQVSIDVGTVHACSRRSVAVHMALLLVRRHAHADAIMAMLLALAALPAHGASAALPIIANTWAFTNATEAAWRALHDEDGAGSAVLRAVEQVLLLCVACPQTASCMRT